MTYVLDSNCSQITLDSAYLASNNQSVNLFWDKNCSGTVSKISIPTGNTAMYVYPSDLGGDTTFDDGVYYFKVEITQEDGSLITESLCRFINCQSSCEMLPVYKQTDNESLIKQLAFEALLASNNCTSCACADLCTLYTNTGLTEIDNDNCGCS